MNLYCAVIIPLRKPTVDLDMDIKPIAQTSRVTRSREICAGVWPEQKSLAGDGGPQDQNLKSVTSM